MIVLKCHEEIMIFSFVLNLCSFGAYAAEILLQETAQKVIVCISGACFV